MKRIKKGIYSVPKIIKEELGDEVYNTISKIIEESPEERDFVIWASPEFIDAINNEIEKELKTKYNIL